MLIQYASDLHLEFLERRYPDARLIEPAPSAEVLILAGDIHHADRAVEIFGDWPCPVIYVAGNHESYGTDILKVHARIRERLLARSGLQAFHFLENEAVVIGGVRFLGATLWTDYQLMDYRMTQAAAMRNAKVGLNDHRMITLGGERFDPADALSLHWGSRTWLAQELDKKADPTLEGFETTVVVTPPRLSSPVLPSPVRGGPDEPGLCEQPAGSGGEGGLLGPRPCARQLRLRGGRLPGDGQPGGVCAQPWVGLGSPGVPAGEPGV